MPFPMLQPPRAPLIVELDADSGVLEVEVGPNGKAHVMSIDQLIRFAAARHQTGR